LAIARLEFLKEHDAVDKIKTVLGLSKRGEEKPKPWLKILGVEILE
jgi:hypothetical protein